jgi:hypothetical protein
MKNQKQYSYIAGLNPIRGEGARLQAPSKPKCKKNVDFVVPMTSEVSRDLLCNRNQTLKSADY